MLDYECPHCKKELDGGFGENVDCDKCDKSYETDFDYGGGDYDLMSWLTGIEFEGKVNLPC